MRILLAAFALAALVAAKPAAPDDRSAGTELPAGVSAPPDRSARPPGFQPSAAADKPAADAPVALPASTGPSRPGRFERILAWLDGSGIPRWAWAPLLVLALAFFRLIFRRGGRGDDLMRPPPSMRRGSPPRHRGPS